MRVPTFLYQVHDDSLTDPSDVQTMFDNVPVADKKLQWIYGTTARWDGYLEFQRRPQPMLDFFMTSHVLIQKSEVKRNGERNGCCKHPSAE